MGICERYFLQKHVIQHLQSTPGVIKGDPYRMVNTLHWVVEHRVKPSALAHCFQHGQVKVHGPPPIPIDIDLNGVGEEI